MNGFYLSISTLFLFVPIIIYLCNKNKPISETILALLLLINIILSFSFWINPIEKSSIHIYDGFFAKISYILFIIYILFIKKIDYKIKIVSLIILLLTLIMFYYSNINSKKWCSNPHLVYHFIFHLLSSIGCSIAFL